MNKKVVQKRAQEWNQDLHDAWRVKLLLWRAHQLVFLDESAVNETTLQRRKGWALIGQLPLLYAHSNALNAGQSCQPMVKKVS